MNDQLVIPRRFNGPRDSGHGGYSSGVVANLVDGDAEVRLRAPPPLERPLRIERAGDGATTVFDGQTLIAEGHPTELDLKAPPPVSIEAAQSADAAAWLENHPFPTCFGCGPEREPGDGLRLFVGTVAGEHGLFACPFTPDSSLAAGSELAPEMVWAALDCPSAGPAPNPGNSPPIVLASMAVTQSAPVAVGEPHVIVSRLAREDGRKRFTSVALYSDDGELKALGRSLWISLRE